MPLCLGHLVIHGHLVVPTGVMMQQWLWIFGTLDFSLHSSYHPNDGDLNGYWIWWWMGRPRCLLVQWNFGPFSPLSPCWSSD